MKIIRLLLTFSVFTLPMSLAAEFQQQAYVKASNTDTGDGFGRSVAISGDTLVVGAPGKNNASGAVYVFVRDGNTWTQQAYLKAAWDESATDFGKAVAIDGDTIVVGAPREYRLGGNLGISYSDIGAVYVFSRSNTTWSQQAYLKASNADNGDHFGTGIAIAGNTLVIGASGEASSSTGVNGPQHNNQSSNSGAAYVFTRTSNTWSQKAYLKASNTDQGDYFGHSVTIDGNTIVVGAVNESSGANVINGNQSDNSVYRSGAAYAFTQVNGKWSQQAYLKGSEISYESYFGKSLSLSENTLVVGAPSDSWRSAAPNAVHIFVRDGSAWSEQFMYQSFPSTSLGASVAIDGDALVAGRPRESSSGTGINSDSIDRLQLSGAAHMLPRTGSAWASQAFIKASNTDAEDYFGTSVAIAGDTVAVGAPSESSNATGIDGNQSDNSAENAGAVYIFAVFESYAVGGTVYGLAGTGLTLQNNVDDDIVVESDGPFSFPKRLPEGGQYNVSVLNQPTSPNQICTLSNGNGILPAADITNVEIDCITNMYSIGFTVSNLIGSGLILQNNGDDGLAVNANGSYSFPTSLADGSAYEVSVLVQPTDPEQTCKVSKGSGVLGGNHVDNITIKCMQLIFESGFE